MYSTMNRISLTHRIKWALRQLRFMWFCPNEVERILRIYLKTCVIWNLRLKCFPEDIRQVTMDQINNYNERMKRIRLNPVMWRKYMIEQPV